MFDPSYWPFFFVSILGAIVANATGAGGGIVFVPAFTIAGLDQQSIIATSFAIQCFGMTAGMIAWHRYSNKKAVYKEWKPWGNYKNWTIRFAIPSIIGIVIGQYLFKPQSIEQINIIFKSFSFLFGLAILATCMTFLAANQHNLSTESILTRRKWVKQLALPIGFIGGLITAWLSIGVGELVAVLLIILRFPIAMAITIAVSVSAISVWVGIQYHLWITNTIEYKVLVFAAPAAVIGGTVAKYLANAMPPVWLKGFIGCWILISAILV